MLPGEAICSSPNSLFPLHHCWAMTYIGTWTVLLQKPDELWGGWQGIRFGGLGMLFFSLRVPSLLVGDPWFDHHTSSGVIHRDVTIPVTTKPTGRDMPGSKTASNSSQHPWRRLPASVPLFSHRRTPSAPEELKLHEQVRRGWMIPGFLLPNHKQRTRAETWLHEDLKSRASCNHVSESQGH